LVIFIETAGHYGMTPPPPPPPPPSGIVRHAPGDSSVYLKTKPVKSEFFMFIGFNPLTIIEFQIKKIFSCKINLQMSLESQLKRKKNPL
jgi:hypothetical protein